MDTNLITYMRNQLAGVPVDFQRYMYERINWNDRLFGLVGPRGVGKTILFLQYIKQNFDRERILYISADNTYFAAHSLVDTADEFSREGGQHLFIDEIHKYPSWSRELKQIYDTHPDLKIAFTGSSILDINKGEADLSRRAPMYYMQGLSFREYLAMFHKITVPKYEMEDILANRAEIAAERHPLPLFRDYLQRGYYPFAADSRFDVELNQVINFTMEVDIPQFAKMNVATGQKLKKLLAIVAESSPFKPVMDKISKMINVSRNDVGDYFYYLERAGMIGQLRDATGGIIGLGKVEKIYLDNTNLAYVLGGNATNIGNVRETFFFNQMRVNHKVTASEVADFKIDNITFEVGGKSKGLRQIANVNDGFVVKDDIEYGSGNIVPLWAFGLNY